MHDFSSHMALDRSRDLQRAAAHERLVADATASRPGTADRAALAASDALVAAGLRLERWARYRRLRRTQTHLHAWQ